MTKMATKMYNGHGAVGDLQEATAKTTPRREDGPCGHCGGAIYLDPDLGFTCRMCNRAAGPPTPEEIRRGILRELTSQAEGLLSPEDFAATFVSLADLGRICGVSKKSFREWLKYHGWTFDWKRSPSNGRWAHYVTVQDARKIIAARR